MLARAAVISASKVATLTHALKRPEERPQAAEALRLLIERIVLTPGNDRGALFAALRPRMDGATGHGKAAKTTKPAAEAAGLSVSVVAGVRSHRCRHSLEVAV
ncbi:hypothetical protein MKI84_10255 [Ancylobacter sp. A5.8]|uniref:hypothetical protein n=1 Tax=Ancylobacter gelatini TaxID=2919920 RepID=UPI001F4E1D3C|nr:hypothetical protein [Ancylobacter gelatini]MCJ8143298.1 hypothetical protein [Ancylobacter gelatini]